jgi:hypothetical protein
VRCYFIRFSVSASYKRVRLIPLIILQVPRLLLGMPRHGNALLWVLLLLYAVAADVVDAETDALCSF